MTIPEIIRELNYCEGRFPHEAVEEAIAQRDAIIPELLQILRYSIDNIEKVADDPEYLSTVFAMYLLAQFREERAYPLIVEFISSDNQKAVNTILDDVNTEALDRILASVCGGDTGPIKQIINNPSIDEYIRAAGLDVFMILMNEGVMSRDEVIEYYRGLFHGEFNEPNYLIWALLISNICDLYPEELMPEIEQAYADDVVDTGFIRLEDVQRCLAKGKDYALTQMAENRYYHYINDTQEELEGWGCFQEDEGFEISPDTVMVPPSRPETAWLPAPERAGPKIGHNDPCPCGSGKKYKKCCME